MVVAFVVQKRRCFVTFLSTRTLMMRPYVNVDVDVDVVVVVIVVVVLVLFVLLVVWFFKRSSSQPNRIE